jgi:hypothetical protein
VRKREHLADMSTQMKEERPPTMTSTPFETSWVIAFLREIVNTSGSQSTRPSSMAVMIFSTASWHARFYNAVIWLF